MFHDKGNNKKKILQFEKVMPENKNYGKLNTFFAALRI